MYQMVVLVLDELEKSADVLDAWEEVGVTGVTILESTGLGRLRFGAGMRDDIPIMLTLSSLMQTREEQHRTMFTLVQGDETVDRLIEATQSVTGNLDGPNRGILFVLPVMRTVGIALPEE